MAETVEQASCPVCHVDEQYNPIESLKSQVFRVEIIPCNEYDKKATLDVYANMDRDNASFNINYCPVCGRRISQN